MNHSPFISRNCWCKGNNNDCFPILLVFGTHLLRKLITGSSLLNKDSTTPGWDLNNGEENKTRENCKTMAMDTFLLLLLRLLLYLSSICIFQHLWQTHTSSPAWPPPPLNRSKMNVKDRRIISIHKVESLFNNIF